MDSAARRPAPGLPVEPPRAAAPYRIHLVGNAHLDPVWLWPWQEGYAEARATFASAIERMDEYDDFIFSCDQMVLLDWVKESDPVLFERIRARVAEGRWVNVGGWWVEPDCNAPMGESFVRQGLYGQRFLLAEFGVAATVGMNVDPFGHNAMIPAILRGQGMDSYTFLRPGPHEADLFDTPFWWRAPDGSQVLASRIPFEYCSPPGDISFQTEKALGQLDRGFSPMMVFYGVGNHGGGPTRANIDSIHRYQRLGSFGELIMSSPRDFFDEVTAAGTDALPTWSNDLQHHAAGCYSAHSAIKAWQRRAQHAVLAAERWAAIADVLGAGANPALRYPTDDLGRAWKQVLFNQFHDVLPGSAIESAYDDARDQLGEAVSISKRIIVRAHNIIARQIDIPMVENTQPVVVFNPHPWPVTAPIEINYGGQPNGAHVRTADDTMINSQPVQQVSTTDHRARGALVFQADLPPLGYRLYRIHPGAYAPATELDVQVTDDGQVIMSNPLLQVRIDPRTGWLTSLLDRRTGAELAGTGPHLQLCSDPTDTWGHRVVSYAWPGDEMPVDRIRVVESGPVRASVRVERSWGRSTMIETFVLGRDSDALEVRYAIDWHEPGHLLKVRFPVSVEDPTATYEIPFATLERPVDGAEEPAQSWVDLTGTTGAGRRRQRAGLAVINNAKHGYDASPADSPVSGTDPSIGISAVRSPVFAWHDPKELEEDGIYTYQAQGFQEFRCLLVPHAGDWRSAQPTRRAAELGSAPRAMLETFHDGTMPSARSFVEVITTGDDGQVLATAIKGAEDATDDGRCDLIVRLSETNGRRAAADVLLPVVGRTISCELTPYQLRTFRVPVDRRRRITEVNLLELDDKINNAEQPFRQGRR
ncbi:alpha-mannosidase [Microlunatus elymi]|uniref:alpha-mannosidase n=1 Tax=Microlunatus elymi TaxID=2596828 RepID=UPI001AEFB7C6|nr:alpha-mannosidase [Microlunatus elymi]